MKKKPTWSFTVRNTVDMTAKNKAIELLDAADLPGGITQNRICKLSDVIDGLTKNELSRLRIETCTHGGGDPERYGKAKKRAGRAVKIGHAGRHSGGKEIQIWAIWA
jgi:hypothetical protein